MTPTPTIHPHSFLGRLSTHQPLITSAGKELVRLVPYSVPNEQAGGKMPIQAILVSIDNGNDALKGAMLHARDPLLRTQRIVTAYAPARIVRAGEGVTTWQVNDSEPFWIGEDAVLTHKAESLPIGMTEERLADQRFRHFLCACLVELLIDASYPTRSGEMQGTYDLYLSLGIPPEELDRRGPKESVRRALLALLNTPFTVRRRDEQDQSTTWVLRLVDITPYPQTFASFATWYYTSDGLPIETDIVKHITLDIGGGHLHECQVDLMHQLGGRPKLRMSASLLGEGTIAMARAVRDTIRTRYPGVHLSDAQAQQVLTSGAVTIEGRRVRVDEVVAEVINARSQNPFTQLLPLLQERQSFVMFTGGGSLLLSHSLRRLVSTKRSLHSVLFVPDEFAPVLNAIGGYVLVQASAQRLVDRHSATGSSMRRQHE
ncbi:MAG TPA: hypothetical protein VF043_30905 [Ktedonobacteraceae bacterium]